MAKATKTTAKKVTPKKPKQAQETENVNVQEKIQSGADLGKTDVQAVDKTSIPETDVSKSQKAESSESEAAATTESNTETDKNADIASKEDNVKQLFVVIPYLAKAAAGGELKYAMRSIAASFPDAKLVVVGDKEDWFSDEIIHLEHTPESDNPQVDVAQKLLLAIASGAIENDSFILSNDDIFLLGDTCIEDILVHKANGELNADVGSKGGKYNENVQNSSKALKAEKLPVHRYGTHTPVVLKSNILAEVLEKYKADEEGHLVTSLYFNAHYPNARPIQVNGGKHDPILVSVYRGDAPKEILEEAIAKRKFLNVNDAGWKSVEPYMAKMYPDKSKWEK